MRGGQGKVMQQVGEVKHLSKGWKEGGGTEGDCGLVQGCYSLLEDWGGLRAGPRLLQPAWGLCVCGGTAGWSRAATACLGTGGWGGLRAGPGLLQPAWRLGGGGDCGLVQGCYSLLGDWGVGGLRAGPGLLRGVGGEAVAPACCC